MVIIYIFIDMNEFILLEIAKNYQVIIFVNLYLFVFIIFGWYLSPIRPNISSFDNWKREQVQLDLAKANSKKFGNFRNQNPFRGPNLP